MADGVLHVSSRDRSRVIWWISTAPFTLDSTMVPRRSTARNSLPVPGPFRRLGSAGRSSARGGAETAVCPSIPVPACDKAKKPKPLKGRALFAEAESQEADEEV